MIAYTVNDKCIDDEEQLWKGCVMHMCQALSF